MVLFFLHVMCLLAHKLYAVRLRVINSITGEAKWVTVAYVPVVKTLKEPGGKERSRQRRAAVLQRVLYLVLRSTIVAGNEGVTVQDPRTGRSVVAFPRVLSYICDQPEERAVLCLKGGSCARPCSLCDVNVKEAGSSVALEAKQRDVLVSLDRQYEAAECRRQSRRKQQRAALEAVDSSNGYVPALACMPGLSTAPHLLYRMIGFDTLHVSLLPVLLFERVGVVAAAQVVDSCWRLGSWPHETDTSFRLSLSIAFDVAGAGSGSHPQAGAQGDSAAPLHVRRKQTGRWQSRGNEASGL